MPAIAAPIERARPDMRLLGLLALGHMVVDINQGSLAALLPFLRSTLALSYTATGIIVVCERGGNGRRLRAVNGHHGFAETLGFVRVLREPIEHRHLEHRVERRLASLDG